MPSCWSAWSWSRCGTTCSGAVNDFNEQIYARMSLARKDQNPEYIITRTRLRSPAYDGAIEPILTALRVGSAEEWKEGGAEGLVVLRSTIMDPFLTADPPAPDHVGGLVAALQRACRAVLGTEAAGA